MKYMIMSKHGCEGAVLLSKQYETKNSAKVAAYELALNLNSGNKAPFILAFCETTNYYECDGRLTELSIIPVQE